MGWYLNHINLNFSKGTKVTAKRLRNPPLSSVNYFAKGTYVPKADYLQAERVLTSTSRSVLFASLIKDANTQCYYIAFIFASTLYFRFLTCTSRD